MVKADYNEPVYTEIWLYLELRTGRIGSGQPINPIRYFFSGRVGSGQPIDPTWPVTRKNIRVRFGSIGSIGSIRSNRL